MNTVISSDTIFATVTNHGKIIFKATLGGMTSIEDIVRSVNRSIRGIAAGMVTVILRNSSQGWAMRRQMRLSVETRHVTAEAVQLTLF